MAPPAKRRRRNAAEHSEDDEADDVSEEPGKATKEINVLAATFAPLDPEAEMLPASYTGVKSPGVDHMELRLTPKSKGSKLASGLKVITLEDVMNFDEKLKNKGKTNKYANYPAGYPKKSVNGLVARRVTN